MIKAQEHRTQEQNREEALQRLQDFIKSAICLRHASRMQFPNLAKRANQLAVLNRNVWIVKLSARKSRLGAEKLLMSNFSFNY